MDPKLNDLKEKYKQIPIPEELDLVVQKAIKQTAKGKRTMGKKWIAGVSAAAIVFIVGINTSSTVASAFSTIPGVDSIVKVLTFREYKVDEQTYNADLKVPAINNLNNKELESALNEKYLAENKQLFEEFQAEVAALKEQGGGHLGVESGYEVMTDNDQLLAIRRYTVNTVASSSTIMKYDTIDKENEILLSLPMLFKDEQYITLISDNIKEQMTTQMKNNPDISYWINTEQDDVAIEEFERIQADNQFYITNEGKLVIAFDKYEVAPGYMGNVEFVIPTEVIASSLMSQTYIR